MYAFLVPRLALIRKELMRRKITNTQRKVRRRKYTNLRRKDLFLFRTSPGASTHAEWNTQAQNTEYGMFFFLPFFL